MGALQFAKLSYSIAHMLRYEKVSFEASRSGFTVLQKQQHCLVSPRSKLDSQIMNLFTSLTYPKIKRKK